MIFPGLRKLGNELNFENNGTYIYGFLNNTFVMFSDGTNQKIVTFKFSIKLDEDDKKKILFWKKKGYAKYIEFLENQTFDVSIIFTEYFIPFKISKIKEVIEDITDYMKNKYSNLMPKCCGDNCISNLGFNTNPKNGRVKGLNEVSLDRTYSGLSVYDIEGIPIPLCPSCVNKLENLIETEKEDFEQQQNNYLQGTLLAILFSIPGIFVTFIFLLLGRIAAISGLVYFFLAQKGYMWAKGKMNKIGIIIISLVSLLYTAIGMYVSYIAIIVKELFSYPDMKGFSIIELIKITLMSLNEPEIKKELLSNIYLSLFVCGIFIVIKMFETFKENKKSIIKKIDES